MLWFEWELMKSFYEFSRLLLGVYRFTGQYQEGFGNPIRPKNYDYALIIRLSELCVWIGLPRTLNPKNTLKSKYATT